MLKIGVIGVGHLAETHLKLLKEINNFELVGYYDADEPFKQNIANKQKIKH